MSKKQELQAAASSLRGAVASAKAERQDQQKEREGLKATVQAISSMGNSDPVRQQLLTQVEQEIADKETEIQELDGMARQIQQKADEA